MRALVLSGGGARGAFQAGVIRSLAARGFFWDVIAGVSVGAINGSFIAQFPKGAFGLYLHPANKLIDFWQSIEGNRSIYREWPLGKLQSLWKGSLYDTSPLRKIIKDNLSPVAIKSFGVKLIVGATCLETGEYRSVDVASTNDMCEWILASSAFPVAFPPSKINGANWVDGGVRDITPITDVLDLKPDHIDVILTAPLGVPAGSFNASSANNALNVALRTANLMADEVFNSDLDRVPEHDRSRITVYSPPVDLKLPDALDFDPKSIRELIEAGKNVGMR